MQASNEAVSNLPTADILRYWFGDLDDGTPMDMRMPQVRRWHAKDPQTDEEIRAKFGGAYDAQRPLWQSGDCRPTSPQDRLAAVILFDQFPRNMFRDTPGMYETDGLAVRLCQEGIGRREDEGLTLVQRMFLYMPLMHAEDIWLQDRTVELFRGLGALAQERSSQNVGFFDMALGFANKHRDIVARFGRYPHRNTILGRASTDEEVAFLKQENSSF
jgi:uncharacterized protein (DUF924 family)